MRHLHPSAEFRQSWQYTNLAYVVASSFPEYLYDIPYTTYVQDNIFTPLGMNDTTYDVQEASRTGRRADSFMRRNMNLSACMDDLKGKTFGKRCQGDVVDIGWMKDTTRDAGAGGLITSARDMVSPFVWFRSMITAS
jgi:CubicO group peptidase (beta-lactamase class C family)